PDVRVPSEDSGAPGRLERLGRFRGCGLEQELPDALRQAGGIGERLAHAVGPRRRDGARRRVHPVSPAGPDRGIFGSLEGYYRGNGKTETLRPRRGSRDRDGEGESDGDGGETHPLRRLGVPNIMAQPAVRILSRYLLRQ